MRSVILAFAAMCSIVFAAAATAQPSSPSVDRHLTGANRGDSIASSYSPELTMLVSGADFGPRALGSTAANGSALSLTNIGGPDVRISTLILDGDTSAIRLDTAGLLGRTIAAGSMISAPATFVPTEPREYTLSVRVLFEPDQGGEFTATIRGQGVDSSTAVRVDREATGRLVAVPLDASGRDVRVQFESAGSLPRFDLIAVDGRVVRSWEREFRGMEGGTRLSLEGIPSGWYRLQMRSGMELRSVTIVVR